MLDLAQHAMIGNNRSQQQWTNVSLKPRVAARIVILLVEDRPVEALVRGRDIQGRVLLVEAGGLKVNANLLDRHNGEVLRPGVVGKTESVPEDNVGVLYIVLASSPLLDTLALSALVGELAGGIELIVLVLSDPDIVLSEASTAVVEAGWLHEHLLAGQGLDLV